MSTRSLVLFDSDCGFCRWSLAKLLAWDRRRLVRPIAIQSAEGQRLLDDMPEAQRLSSWHLIDSSGERHSAGSAVSPLLRVLPGGGPLAAPFDRFPSATQRIYTWVVANRGRLGRLIPAAALRRADARIRQRS